MFLMNTSLRVVTKSVTDTKKNVGCEDKKEENKTVIQEISLCHDQENENRNN